MDGAASLRAPVRGGSAALLAAARLVRILGDAYPHQRAMVAALRARRRCAVIAPRRSGKTEGIARYALDLANARPVRAAWIEDFPQTAWETIQPIFSALALRYGLRFKQNAVHHHMTIGNLLVVCHGVRLASCAEDTRGKPWDLIVIDELQRLFDVDVARLFATAMEPGLADRRGSLIVAYTPGDADTGLAYEITVQSGLAPRRALSEGDDVDVTTQTVAASLAPVLTVEPFSNPATADGLREIIAGYRDLDPELETRPWYQREYLGRWVPDDRGAIVRVPEHALWRTWQPSQRVIIVGMDYGYDPDPCAFVVLAVDTERHRAAFLHGHTAGRLLDHEVAAQLDTLSARFGRIDHAVMDPGGGGKSTIGALTITHGAAVAAAEKWDKAAAIRSLCSDFAAGKVGLHHHADPERPDDHPLAAQWRALRWIYRRNGRDEGRPRHLHDAALYAWREAKRYLYPEVPQQAPPTHQERMRAWRPQQSWSR